MPSSKRRRGASISDDKMDEEERSPTPTGPSSAKKRKKELQYDPQMEASCSTSDFDPMTSGVSQSDDVDISEIIQELFETIRNYKSEEGKLLCESFIRAPKRRTNPDYYEIVKQPLDMLKIQQKLKTDEYEEIEQLTADVELLVSNARAYYKKGSQEYIDATDLLDLYYEIRDELLVETFGDGKEALDDDDDEDAEPDDSHVNLEQIQSKIGSIIQQEQEAAKQSGTGTSAVVPDPPSEDGTEAQAWDPEDFEQLFACVVNAQDGDRSISEPFHLLPYKTLYPNYYEVIKEPIDLKMIARKIQDNEYKTLDEMEKDINLMVTNAKTFNEPKSLIYKDACTLKKVFDVKKREMEQRKTANKSSDRIRTRGGQQKLSAQFAALEYPEPLDPTDIMEYEEDSGAETVMSEEESPMWNLFNAVKNFTLPDGAKIIDPYMKLPSRRYYPDYYEEIKKPLSIINVQKKLKTGYYGGLDDLAADLNLVFDNAKRYNADESVIYKNACLLQKIIWEKKKELEKFGFKEMSIPELGIHFEFPMLNTYEEDHSVKKGRKSLTPAPDSEKKKVAPVKKYGTDEMLRKRLWQLYRTIFEYADSTGRLLRQIFMFLPSKRDYPDYYKVIADPIDLSTIEQKIKSDKYPSEYNLMSDFDLMFKNAKHYNEEGSQVYSDAATLEKALKAKWRIINQSAGVPRPTKTKTRKGPAPTSLSSRLQDLYETVRDYQDTRGRTLSSPFMKVPLKSDYPDYYEVIKRPIDMSHIQQKMLLKKYELVEDMVSDFVLMFDNACKYNEPDSLIYKDALTLQRICLEKKQELSDDWSNDVPDVRAGVQQIMTNLFISTYNHQDEEGRCYSDSFSELPDRDTEVETVTERPLTFDLLKRNLDRGRYRRLDKFQEDMFRVFDRARRLSRTDSQLYEDAVEMQMYFIKVRDDLCKNGEILLTPALSFTEKHLQAIVEAEKSVKILQEQTEDEKKKAEGEDTPQESAAGEGSENSVRYKDQVYSVGDFVYVEPRSKTGRHRSRKSKYKREPDAEPHIMCIEKIFTDNSGQQQVYGNWFYRPNETFHLATRKFLQKEVFKSDYYTSITMNQILSPKCYVMNVREYFKLKPEGYADNDVYVCEFRYTARTKTFKKIKVWAVPRIAEMNFVERETPLMPVRIASVFADKVKDDFDDGDTSVLDKLRMNVVMDGQPSTDPHVFYEQLKTNTGCYKVGDCVYVKSDDKPMIYRIDRIWSDSTQQAFFYGPLFIRPADIEHPPTRLFYKREMFLCGVEETRTMDSIVGKCSVLWVKDYCNCRLTEVAETDVYICESKYHETEKTLRRLSKGLKKHSLSPRVTDDEVLFFRKPVIPTKVDNSPHVTHLTKQEPSPLLSKQAEDTSLSYDGDESRDTFPDVMPEILNTSMDDFNMVPIAADTKTPKRVDDIRGGDSSKKKGKAKDANKRTQISGYIVFSGEFRKIVQQQNPDCNFGEISRLVGGKGRGKRFPSGYLLFSAAYRKQLSDEQKGNFTFGEISRLVGIKWRNLEKEEKEKYEEKAKKIAEEQQAKQEAATKAFNESLSKTQQTQQWTEQQQQQQQQQTNSAQAQTPRPATPGNTGYPGGYYGGQFGGIPFTPTPGLGGQFTPMNPAYTGHELAEHLHLIARNDLPGVHQNGMNGHFMSPRGQMQPGPRAAFLPQHYPSGVRSPYPGMNTPGPYGQTPPVPPSPSSPYPGGPVPYPGMTQQGGLHAALPSMSAQQVAGQQQMAPPPAPPRPPSPMFVTVPPRTQRLLHSEAYLKYIEGLNAESRSISDWEKSLTATQENTPVPDESRLPAHWLGQGTQYQGSVTDALWALRDLMLKDSLNIQRTLPFDALWKSSQVGSI